MTKRHGSVAAHICYALVSMARIACRSALLLSLIATALAVASPAFSRPLRLACIGDSITAGAGATTPRETWPAVLGKMLGEAYDVHNFGVGGTTMLKHGDSPYWLTSAFTDAQAYAPDIVIITLGTNDTKPQNWDTHSSEFPGDATAMLDVFKSLPSHPRVILALPIPVFGAGNYGIRKDIMDNGVKPDLLQVAQDTKTETLDMYAAMQDHGDQVGDNVHPTSAGYLTMAKYIFRYLTSGGPIITPSTDMFLKSATVSISTDKDAAYTVYTTNGSDPKLSSPHYTAPIAIDKTTTVKARSVAAGKLGDFIATATITKTSPLPATAVKNPQPGLILQLFSAPADQLADHFAALTNPVTSTAAQIALPADAPAANFGLAFSGYINIAAPNIYTFTSTSDDGSRLYIDDKLVVDNWGYHGPAPLDGDIALDKGYHAIRVEFFQGGGGDALSASYGSDTQPTSIIPADVLVH